MVNFLKAESYRALRQPSTRAILLISIALVIFLSVQIRFLGYVTPTLFNYYDTLVGMMAFGIYTIAAVVTASFEKDRAMLTQLIAQGHSKTRIVITQYISSLGMSFAFVFLLSLLSIALGWLLYQNEQNKIMEYIGMIAELGFYSFAILVPLQAIAISLQYIFFRSSISIAMFFVVTLVLPMLLEFTRTVNRAVNLIMLYTPYDQLYYVFTPSFDLSIFIRTIAFHLEFWIGLALLRFRKLEL